MKRYYKPPQKNKKKSGLKVFGSLIVLLVILGVILSAWFVLQLLNPVRFDSSPSFTITQGESVNKISYNLKQQGLIKNSFVFEAYVYLKDIQGQFQAGEYELPSVVNTKRLVEILITGEKVKEWDLKVIEGWTVKDIAWQLENMGKFQAEELLEATGVNQPNNKFSFDISKHDFLKDKPRSANLEGYLFPDTYRFFHYATIDDVVRKMLNNFNNKLDDELRQEIKNQDKTIFEIITMASIIEQEVRSNEDRAVVSGIFWKRVESGIPLQADSTINYITGKNTPAVSAEDLKIDSFYNTYMYADLPPGPICNPGLSSIKAAIYPEESEYWFFLTDKEGNVHYSKDFDSHVKNKAKYL